MTPRSGKLKPGPERGGKLAVSKGPRGAAVLVPGDVIVRLEEAESPDVLGARWATAEARLADRPGFHVWARIRSFEGRVEIVEVQLRKELPHAPWASPESITTRMLRSVPLGLIHQEAYRTLREAERARRIPPGVANHFRSVPRPGRRGRPDIEYARIAAQYLDWCARSGAPVRAMADELGMSSKSLGNLLHEARARGLLTRQGQGVAGGELTEEAKALLLKETT